MKDFSDTIDNESITYQIERLAINNDTEQEDFISALFFCCFDYMIGNLSIDALQEDSQYNYEDFKDICIKYNLKKYAPYLYIHCRVYKENTEDEVSSIPQKKQNEEFKYQLQLIESLIPLFTVKDQGLRININTSLEKAVLTDDKLITIVKESLFNEYLKNNLNQKKLTFEEAKKVIENNQDLLWIEKYKNRWLIKLSLKHKEFEVDEALIEEYANEHYSEQEVSLTFLQEQLKTMKATKRGRPAENDKLGQLAERISYLIRFDRFLSEKEYSDIETYSLSNEDCRFISECVSFFNLGDEENAKTHNNIRTRIEQYRKNRKNKYISEKSRFVEQQINQIKKHTREERSYDLIFCRFWDVKMIDYKHWDLT